MYVEPSISTGVRIGLANDLSRAVREWIRHENRPILVVYRHEHAFLVRRNAVPPAVLLYSPFWLNMYSSLYCQRAALS
ncbi:MAG: hypothetical protein ACLS6G_06780 [Christensenellales bacterium]